MDEPRLWFRVHAIQRMHERRISEIDVREVLENGDVIEDDGDSQLRLGFCDGRPIHVASSEMTGANVTVIITVYEPNLDHWELGFRTRRLR